jgi:hypothetical protein
MVVKTFKIKLTSVMDSLKNKSELIKFSLKTNSLMLLVLLKVKDSQELLKDGVLDTYKKNLTEVTEKSGVLVLGIQQELPGLLLEPVKVVISTELKLIKKFIE